MKKSHLNKTLRGVLLFIMAIFIVLIFSYFISLYDTNIETESTSPAIGQNLSNINSSAHPEIIGNPVDIELRGGMSILYLENPNESVSIRFSAKYSGEVTALTIYAFASETTPQVRIGLQEDNNGMPEGEWINELSFGISQVGSNDKFITVNLQEAVRVSQDSVYHVVIEPVETTENDKITIITYHANGLAQPLNNDNPDIVWNDSKMNILFYDGEEWKEKNKWPIFVIKYADNRSEGQPYSLAAPWVIYNSTYVGQAVLPSSDYRIEKIAFVVALKNEPKDRLYYEIRDSGNKVMAKGLFAEASQLTIWQKWIEITLDSPLALKEGELYMFTLLSPGTDLENAYHIYGHEFTYDTSIGYGGLRHYLTISHDAGTKWAKWEDADTIFKLITTG